MRQPFALVALDVAFALAASAEDWPQWRGPHGNGVSGEKGLPSRWFLRRAAWKARLGGLGISSPIVWGDRVFVTSQAGRSPRRPGDHPTLIRGDEAKDEKPLGAGASSEARRRVPGGGVRPEGRPPALAVSARRRGRPPEVHDKHNLASPSPVTDGEVVIAWFGNGQSRGLSPDGKLLWQRHLARLRPLQDLVGARELARPLRRPGDPALRPRAGLLPPLARQAHGQGRMEGGPRPRDRSRTAPRPSSGARSDELVVNSTTRIDAYDPRTGALLWWAGEPHRFGVPVPAFHDGVLYMSRGYRSGPYLAVKRGRARRRLEDPRPLVGADRRALHLVARLLRRPRVHGERRRGS